MTDIMSHATKCIKLIIDKEVVGICQVEVRHQKYFDKSEYFCEIQDNKLYIALNKNKKEIKSKGWEQFGDNFVMTKYGNILNNDSEEIVKTKKEKSLIFSICDLGTKEFFEVFRCRENLSDKKFAKIMKLMSVVEMPHAQEIEVVHHVEHITIQNVELSLKEAHSVLEKYTAIPAIIKVLLLLIYEEHVPYSYLDTKDYDHSHQIDIFRAANEIGLSVGLDRQNRIFIAGLSSVKFVTPCTWRCGSFVERSIFPHNLPIDSPDVWSFGIRDSENVIFLFSRFDKSELMEFMMESIFKKSGANVLELHPSVSFTKIRFR